MSPRSWPITPEEVETRRIAYSLKLGEEIEIAARENAGLLPPDLPTLTLVPALGFGTGLVFADASPTNHPPAK